MSRKIFCSEASESDAYRKGHRKGKRDTPERNERIISRFIRRYFGTRENYEEWKKSRFGTTIEGVYDEGKEERI